MTLKQLEQARKKARLQKLRAKNKARREREKLRRLKRQEKRRERARPKNRLVKWSQRVRGRDGDACIVCGVGIVQRFNKDGTPKRNKRGALVFSVLHAHHLLPKERYQEFRFKRINGVTLCPIHHKFGKFSAHRNPVWFVEWLKKNRPEQYAWCLENVGEDATVV